MPALRLLSLPALAMLVLALFTDSLRADTRLALVITNAAYAGAALDNPQVDARLVVATLTALDFKVTAISDVGLEQFDLTVQDFATAARGADVVLFYFAGHGFAINDKLKPRSYLMSTDAKIASKSDATLRAGGLALDEIVATLGGQAKISLFFVDACRNDPRVRAPGGGGRGFARLDLPENSSIFVGLSTRLGEVAADGPSGAGSPFARAFAAVMVKPGLRLDDAFTEIRKQVQTETGGRQRPEPAQNDLDAPLVLRPATIIVPDNAAARDLEQAIRAGTVAALEKVVADWPGTPQALVAAQQRLDLAAKLAALHPVPVPVEPAPRLVVPPQPVPRPVVQPQPKPAPKPTPQQQASLPVAPLPAGDPEQDDSPFALIETVSQTLRTVKARDALVCGVGTGLAGFSLPTDKGIWTGLDVDYCRAIATAILGDPGKVKFMPLTAKQRFVALQSGEIDVLVRNSTWTMGREAMGIENAGVNFYDGQGFMVRKSVGAKSALDLSGDSICVQQGTTTELGLANYFKANRIEYSPIAFESSEDVFTAYDSGRCDAVTTDASALFAERLKLANPDDHVVLPERISKEPLGPYVRKGDNGWASLVRWVHFALLTAEEQGVTSANLDEMLSSDKPAIRRLLGKEGDFGGRLGIGPAWAADIIRAVGNYGEIFERNLGVDSPLRLDRGQNRLWSQGGLQFAPPLR